MTILMIRDALKLRPEWARWEQTMVDEKKQHSVEQRVRKAKTKVARLSLPQPPYDVRGEEGEMYFIPSIPIANNLSQIPVMKISPRFWSNSVLATLI